MKDDNKSEDMASEETIMTAAEYSEAVYEWLQQAYQWQALAVGKHCNLHFHLESMHLEITLIHSTL